MEIDHSTPIEVQIRLGEMDNEGGKLNESGRLALMGMRDAAKRLGSKASSLTTQEVIDASKAVPIDVGSQKGFEVLQSL